MNAQAYRNSELQNLRAAIAKARQTRSHPRDEHEIFSLEQFIRKKRTELINSRKRVVNSSASLDRMRFKKELLLEQLQKLTIEEKHYEPIPEIQPLQNSLEHAKQENSTLKQAVHKLLEDHQQFQLDTEQALNSLESEKIALLESHRHESFESDEKELESILRQKQETIQHIQNARLELDSQKSLLFEKEDIIESQERTRNELIQENACMVSFRPSGNLPADPPEDLNAHSPIVDIHPPTFLVSDVGSTAIREELKEIASPDPEEALQDPMEGSRSSTPRHEFHNESSNREEDFFSQMISGTQYLFDEEMNPTCTFRSKYGYSNRVCKIYLARYRQSLLIGWVNSLKLVEPFTPKELPEITKQGILPAEIISAVDPSVTFPGIYKKPLAKKACLHNLELVLRVLYRRSVSRSSLPSSEELFIGTQGKAWELLDVIFQSFVMAEVKELSKSVLSWFHSLLGMYGRRSDNLVCNPDQFKDGVNIACALDSVLGNLDLKNIYWVPQSPSETMHNLAVVFEAMEEVGIPLSMSLQDFRVCSDQDFLLLQLVYIYKALRDRSPKPVDERKLNFKDDARECLIQNYTESSVTSLDYSSSVNDSKLAPKGYFSETDELNTPSSAETAPSEEECLSSLAQTRHLIAGNVIPNPSLSELRVPEKQLGVYARSRNDELHDQLCYLLTPRILKSGKGTPLVCNALIEDGEEDTLYSFEWRNMDNLKSIGEFYLEDIEAIGTIERIVEIRTKKQTVEFECFDTAEAERYATALENLKNYRIV